MSYKLTGTKNLISYGSVRGVFDECMYIYFVPICTPGVHYLDSVCMYSFLY